MIIGIITFILTLLIGILLIYSLNI